MRRMLSDKQVQYLRNKQDKLVAGANISISDSNVISASVPVQEILPLIHECEGASDTPKNITWTKASATGGDEITGTLTASEDTIHQLYYIPDQGADYVYATVKIYSEGAGEYVYSWKLVSYIAG